MKIMQRVVERGEWLEERKELLKEEKALTRQKEALAAKRRELPLVKVEEDYVFAGKDGPVKLSELFDGMNQLMVYHFMFAPEWSQGCKSCSVIADHYDPTIVHLRHRDTNLVTVSRAPIDQLMAFQKRMGWSFPWVSSAENRFNRDFGVCFTQEELKNPLAIYNYVSPPYPITDLPGLSVFVKGDDGTIYHSYSTYARGLDPFINVYNFLDMTPKGRDEDESMRGMAWLRHHDRYGVPGEVNPWEEKA